MSVNEPQADGDSHGYCRYEPRRVRNCPLEACMTLGACCAGGTSALVDTSPVTPNSDFPMPLGTIYPVETPFLSPPRRDRLAAYVVPSEGGSLAASPLLHEPVVTSVNPDTKHAGRQPVQMMPATSQERKDTPICTGAIDYFPLALAAVARLSKFGNDKHNPGQPLHWSRAKSADHADCIVRHLIDRGVIDIETGESHTVEVVWRALALLEVEEEQRLGLPLSRGSR